MAQNQPDQNVKEISLNKPPNYSLNHQPGFVKFPEVNHISQVDFKYHLIMPFAEAHIKWDSTKEQLIYLVEEPVLTSEEKKTLKTISEELVDMIQVGLSAIKDENKAEQYLESQIIKIIESLGISITKQQFSKIMYYIYRDFIGLNKIEPLIRDPWIEDIGCDGVGIPIYVVHRKYGSIQTNVSFSELSELREFVIKLAERCGRYISYAEPILDGTLPDGSRINASLAGDVTTRGPTFSIRKFSERPYSPLELIEFNTASTDIMAYFWYLIENGASILIAGGVATGKTTFLNSICMFIPPEAKIVSIEDTRELKIPHEHWIPAVSRLGFGIPMPTGEKYGEITLFDLLKSSFRQNPDYVIVGEVRGKEAYVLFQGISSGHPSLTTFHAGSIDTVIKRLTTPPIELSPTLVESLDVVVIMSHAKEKGKSARRVKEIEEIKYIDPDSLKVVTNRVAEWEPSNDKYVFYGNSLVVEKIAKFKGITVEEAIKEIENRKSILEWMLKNNIKDFEKVSSLINEYYKNPEKTLSRLQGFRAKLEIIEPKTVEVSVKKEKEPIKVVVEQVVKDLERPPIMIDNTHIIDHIIERTRYEDIPKLTSTDKIKPQINLEDKDSVVFDNKISEDLKETKSGDNLNSKDNEISKKLELLKEKIARMNEYSDAIKIVDKQERSKKIQKLFGYKIIHEK
ncbi:MAG: type II/IV secretion system ATPase subunit [Candidatus Aenigmatarchaeota archaeon]|nr:type II/IV secretion system ATPase subunit [Candidatus Aenigmarchaeota archaeon]